jgi:hypothetical protein
MTAARDPLPDFRALCEGACIKLWGEPNERDRKELRWGGTDTYGSKTFSLAKRVWYDHGEQRGGGLLDLVAYSKGLPKEKLKGKAFIETWAEAHRMGLLPYPPPDRPNGHGGGLPPIRYAYPYPDENGKLQFEVVRFDIDGDPDKRFRQRRSDGNGGWIWDTRGVRTHILYRLPQLIEATKANARVLIPEGEHDVMTAVELGYAATTMPGGVGKWYAEYDRYFVGVDVVVVSDNDPQERDKQTGVPQVHPNGQPVLKGQDHAANVVKHLRKVAGHLRLVIFPQKDLSAWKKAGGDRAALDALIADAPDLIKQPPVAPAPPTGPPPGVPPAGLEDEVALEFAHVHKNDLRFVAFTGKWMIWRSTRWQVENTLATYDAARALCRDAGDAEAKVVAAVEKLARSDRRIAAELEQWDADHWLLATPGGTVDLKSGAPLFNYCVIEGHSCMAQQMAWLSQIYDDQPGRSRQ